MNDQILEHDLKVGGPIELLAAVGMEAGGGFR